MLLQFHAQYYVVLNSLLYTALNWTYLTTAHPSTTAHLTTTASFQCTTELLHYCAIHPIPLHYWDYHHCLSTSVPFQCISELFYSAFHCTTSQFTTGTPPLRCLSTTVSFQCISFNDVHCTTSRFHFTTGTGTTVLHTWVGARGTRVD